MKCKRIWALGICAAALLGFAGAADAADPDTKIADAGARPRAHQKSGSLQVDIYRQRRIGGYSYSRSDVMGSYGASPPPYARPLQSPGGPFDSGFFFDSGIGPR
jgi:hypothetical protein